VSAQAALVSTEQARALDTEASAQWGLHPFALVEAAGRACAGVGTRDWGLGSCCSESDSTFRVHPNSSNGYPQSLIPSPQSLIVLAGKGNNAADALVMLKTLVLYGFVPASACTVFAVQISDDAASPLSQAMLAVQKLNIPVMPWNSATAAGMLANADVVIDGIAGTGLTGSLRGVALEMAEAVNALNREKTYIVSIDMPSGNFDGWQPGMPIVEAHATLAIEPQKLCVYTPSARRFSGTILPVGGIFPPALIDQYRAAELVTWDITSARIPPVSETAYKYERGLVEIRAGSPGATGAALLAAQGAQAAGAGLVRLMVDPAVYPVIAPGCSGIMVAATEDQRFVPDAVLLGPGWGRGDDRRRLLEACVPLEAQGIPLILDADAIMLAKDMVFHGNAIITPHPGEFAAYTGLPKDEILANPVPALRHYAAAKNVHILFKSHVLYVVSPDGRIGVIDGMNPALAAGGSGDVLAGFCAAIAARCRSRPFDGYACACAAASLLVQAAKRIGKAFVDPAEFAKSAAAIAGEAWILKRSNA